MTLALLFLHPGFWLVLLGLGLLGMAINPAGPLVNFGAFTFSSAAQLLALCSTYFSTFAAGVTTGTIPANILTGGLDVFLQSAATTPGTQTTRTAAQLWADAIAQFGPFLNDPAILTNGLQYTLTIAQTGAGTFTLAGGTGVTVTGTATIAQNTSRQYIVNLTPTVATFTDVLSATV
jgi:hypothetical protein